MAAALRSSSSNSGATGSTFVVTAPAGIQNGDVLVAFQYNGNVSGPTAPSGFTLRAQNTPGTVALSCFTKLAASESGNYTFNNVSGLDSSIVWLLCISGLTSAIPDDSSSNSGTGTTLTALAVTTANPNSMVIAGFGSLSPSGTITPNGTFTDIGSLSDLLKKLDAAYFIQAGSGTTGNQTASDTASAGWSALMLTWSPSSPPANVWIPFPKKPYDAWQGSESFPRRITSWLGIQKSFGSIPWFHRVLTENVDVLVENTRSKAWLFKAPIPSPDKIPWRRKLVYTPEPFIESYSRQKTLLPLPLQAQILTSQEGVYGVLNTILLPAQSGIYRIQNDIKGYNLYLGSGSLPDLTAPPAAFSKTLPFQVALTPPGSGTLTYYVLVRTQDHYGLVSQNSYFTTITIDSTGGVFMAPDSPPQELTLFKEEGGFVHILASYPGLNYDAFPANFWQIFAGTVPPNPLVGTPIAMPAVSGNILVFDAGPYTPGRVYFAVRMWRSADSAFTSAISGSILIPTTPPEVIAVSSGWDIQP